MKEKENSIAKLSEALVLLMNEKLYGEISITDISDKAKVSRMAYYRNVQSKEELLRYQIEGLFQEFIQKNRKLLPCSLLQYYENMFDYFLKQKSFFKLLERDGFLYMIKEGIDRYYFEQASIIEGKRPLSEYESYYFSGALYNIILLWQKNGMKETPKEMAELYCHISKGGWEIDTEDKVEC